MPPDGPEPQPGVPPPGAPPPRRVPSHWQVAPGTVVISVLCGLVYLAERRWPVLVDLGASTPALIWAGQWWRVLTAVFLHGSFLHVAFNVAIFWTVGAAVEIRLGTARLVLLTVLTGVAGDLGMMLGASLHSPGAIGLSGAVFGLFYFGWVVFRRHPGAFGQFFSDKNAIVFAVMMLGLWIATLLKIIPIANLGHLFGALTGLVAGAVVHFRGRRRALAWAGAALFAAALVVGAWRPVWTPGYQSFQAQEAFSARHYDLAAQRFARLVARYPKDIDVRTRLALALGAGGHAAEARAAWDGLSTEQKQEIRPEVRRMLDALPGKTEAGVAAPRDGGSDAGTPPSGRTP